jgi:hypothetical protein
MYTEYLKKSLGRLAELKGKSDRIGSAENRDAIKAANVGGISDAIYPSMCGQLEGLIMAANWDVRIAQQNAERLEVIERDHYRFVSILESLGIDIDEETLSALELIGKDTTYRDHMRDIRSAVNKAISDVQWTERDYEHDQAGEALKTAGFTVDEDGETWTRGEERVSITLENGREARYAWGYESKDNGTVPGYKTDEGKSGEFHRLIALIGTQEVR